MNPTLRISFLNSRPSVIVIVMMKMMNRPLARLMTVPLNDLIVLSALYVKNVKNALNAPSAPFVAPNAKVVQTATLVNKNANNALLALSVPNTSLNVLSVLNVSFLNLTFPCVQSALSVLSVLNAPKSSQRFLCALHVSQESLVSQ